MIRIVETSTNDFPLTLIEYARFVIESVLNVWVCGLCTFFASMSIYVEKREICSTEMYFYIQTAHYIFLVLEPT